MSCQELLQKLEELEAKEIHTDVFCHLDNCPLVLEVRYWNLDVIS